MATVNRLDDKEVIREFDRRALLHKDENAVLDAHDSDAVRRHNVYRNYIHKRTVGKYVRPKKEDVLLDFGCGVGRLTTYLSPHVSEVIGVDTSGDMIAIANDNLSKLPSANIRYYHLKDTKIPLEDNSVDKVLAWWVLQHISDDKLQNVLTELYRVMKKDASFVFVEQVRDKTMEYGSIHIQRAPQDYIALLKECGFKRIISKPLFRHPSYGLGLWNKYKLPKFFLPSLAFIERVTLNRKPEFVDYYTNVFEFKK